EKTQPDAVRVRVPRTGPRADLRYALRTDRTRPLKNLSVPGGPQFHCPTPPPRGSSGSHRTAVAAQGQEIAILQLGPIRSDSGVAAIYGEGGASDKLRFVGREKE